MNPRRAAAALLVASAGSAASACGGSRPAPLTCPLHLADAKQTAPRGALVAVGTDTGVSCSGTVVHLEDDAAYVLTARHCLVRGAKLPEPSTHFRVYVPSEDDAGPYFAPVEVRRTFVPTGREVTTRFEDVELGNVDWAILESARDPSMRALELGDGDVPTGAIATVETTFPHNAPLRLCPHAHSFSWGSLPADSFLIGGHSGAAVVWNGRVQAVFDGYHARGLWMFERPAYVTAVSVKSIRRVWDRAS